MTDGRISRRRFLTLAGVACGMAAVPDVGVSALQEATKGEFTLEMLLQAKRELEAAHPFITVPGHIPVHDYYIHGPGKAVWD